MDILQQITQEQIRTDLPDLKIGDTVRVYVKVKEGNRERVQMFEGTIIKKNHGGIQETFTVRRVSYGVGVERTFPVNSPKIDRIEIVRHGRVNKQDYGDGYINYNHHFFLRYIFQRYSN